MQPGFTSANCSAGGSSFAALRERRLRFLLWPLSPGREWDRPLASSTMQAGVEIEFASGAWLRIAGPVDRSTMRAMITALAKPKRRG